MFNKTMNFLNKYILRYNQYGFGHSHFTYMAHLETLNRISDAWDKNSTTVGMFIDLFKAFDTVDHTILLNKLDYCGKNGVALEWLKNYVSGWLQYVEIGGVSSRISPVICGVP